MGGQRGPGLIGSRRGNMAAADAFGDYSQHTLEGPTSSDMPTAALTPIKEERNDESPDTVLGFAQAMRGERDVVLDPYEMTPREGRQAVAQDDAEHQNLNWVPTGPYVVVDGVPVPAPEPQRHSGGWTCNC